MSASFHGCTMHLAVVWAVEKMNFTEFIFMWCVMMAYTDRNGKPAEPKPVVALLLSTESCPGTFASRGIASPLDVNIGNGQVFLFLVCFVFCLFLFYFGNSDRIVLFPKS